ncbi:MAG: hypothetical protein AAGA94_11230 [Pseudomonadota bacterium]
MILRLHIDGNWTAREFSEVFQFLDRYNQMLSFRFRAIAFGGPEELLLQMASRAGPLKVGAIRYGSKGFTDLVGLGAILKEVREFLQFMIMHFREKADRELSHEQKRIEIAHARLKLLQVLQEVRMSKDIEPLELTAQMIEFSELPEFEAVANAIMEGRLSEAEILNEDED